MRAALVHEATLLGQQVDCSSEPSARTRRNATRFSRHGNLFFSLVFGSSVVSIIRRPFAAAGPDPAGYTVGATGSRSRDNARDNIDGGSGSGLFSMALKTARSRLGNCEVLERPKNTRLAHTLVSYRDNTSDNIHPVQGVQSVLHRRQKRRCCTKHHPPVKRPPT